MLFQHTSGKLLFASLNYRIKKILSLPNDKKNFTLGLPFFFQQLLHFQKEGKIGLQG